MTHPDAPLADASPETVLEADYVILGGGSAGCVLAARLSEDPSCRVLLVEAGGDGRGLLVDTPAALVAMLPTRLNNWGFQTVPQAGLDGRRGYQPRGRTLGGSSAINAMVYMRGHPSDYDGWAARGNRGWGWAEVLPYFRRAEGNTRLGAPWHGQDGPLTVSDLRTDNPFLARWMLAARQAGYRLNNDFNGAEQEGFGPVQVTQRNGQRCSTFRAYLEPALKRPNLQVLTGTQATRLLFEGRRCIGAQLQQGPRRGGRMLACRAAAEVIVSAGALQSPQLLLCSGIGAPEALAPWGLAVQHALPGVGRNLHDHVDYIFGYRAPTTDLAGVSPAGSARLLREIGRYRRERRGMLTSNFAEGAGFIRKSPQSLAPEFQLLFVTAIVEDHARRLHLHHGFSCHVSLLRPRSRGRVALQSPSALDAPLIDPAFYADPRDLDDMVQGWKLTHRLMQQPALASEVTRALPSALADGDAAIRTLLRQRSDTVYHPVGSCAMGDPGREPLAVVDDALRVHGLHGLRVVDASVMPAIPGGNTNAPTVMLAERAADLIRGRRPLPAAELPAAEVSPQAGAPDAAGLPCPDALASLTP